MNLDGYQRLFCKAFFICPLESVRFAREINFRLAEFCVGHLSHFIIYISSISHLGFRASSHFIYRAFRFGSIEDACIERVYDNAAFFGLGESAIASRRLFSVLLCSLWVTKLLLLRWLRDCLSSWERRRLADGRRMLPRRVSGVRSCGTMICYQRRR